MAWYPPAARHLWAEFVYWWIGIRSDAACAVIRVFWAAADLPCELFGIYNAADSVCVGAVDSGVASVSVFDWFCGVGIFDCGGGDGGRYVDGTGALCTNDDLYCVAVSGANARPDGGGVYQWEWGGELEVDVLGDYYLGWADACVVVLFRSGDISPGTTAEPSEEAAGKGGRGSTVVGKVGEDG